MTVRFIPAYAGNSRHYRQKSAFHPVHPRLRGELRRCKYCCHLDGGSSPLTRGTRRIKSRVVALSRFIPAYAGNSDKRPRPRREQHGSSPLTRGTQKPPRSLNSLRRFIPAYAGNSVAGVPARNRRTVHPRLRGELLQRGQTKSQESGSSPLTRGTHRIQANKSDLNRFIPAYAGNSVAGVPARNRRTVHPRLRGELSNSVVVGDPFIGSSPLTRGTHHFLILL